MNRRATADDSRGMDPEQIVLVFDRIEIETGAIDKIEEDLSSFALDRETVEKYAGRITFVFHGWEADRREMYEIPEAKEWFRNLTAAFPYWFIFLDRSSYIIPTALNLILGPGVKGIGPSGEEVLQHKAGAVSAVVAYLFDGMNTLCSRLGIPPEINSRWTKEVGQCLAAYTD